jgi:hypothetical protein
MGNIVHTVKIAEDARDAIAKIREYGDVIVGVASTIGRYERQLGNDALLKNAHNMVAAVESLGGVFALTDANQAKLSRTLAEAIQQYERIGEQAPAAMRTMELQARNAVEATEQVRGAASGAEDASIGAGVAFGLMAERAASGLMQMAAEMVTTAARTEGLTAVAEYLGTRSGQSRKEIDGLIDSLKHQGITTQESANLVIRLSQANIGLEHATKLATTAQNSAFIAGMSTSEALGLLLQGVVTLQPELIRSAGITVSLEQAEKAYTAAHGGTIANLTSRQKQEILLQAVLAEGAKLNGVYELSMGYVGKQMASLARYTEETQNALGQKLLPAVGVGVTVWTTFLKVVTLAPGLFDTVGLAIASVVGPVMALKAAAALGVTSMRDLTGAAFDTAGGLSKLQQGALVATAAFAGWSFGRWIAELTDMDSRIANFLNRLNGWTLAQATAEAQQMSIAKAIRDGADANITYAEAVEVNRMATTAAGEANGAAAVHADLLKAAVSSLSKETQAAAVDAFNHGRSVAAASTLLEAHGLATDKDAAALNLLHASWQANNEAMKKHYAAFEEIRTAGLGWRGTLEGIAGAVVASVRLYLEAGVSQAALAEYYHLTATQVRAVASSLEEEKKAHEHEQAAILQSTKLWAEYEALRMAHGGTATEAAIAQIDRWAADVTAQAHKAGTDTAEFYRALEALSSEKTASVLVDWNHLRQVSIKTYEDMAARAWATYDEMIAASGDYSRQAIQDQRDAARAADQTARDAAHGTEAVGAALTDTAAKAGEFGYVYTLAMQQGAAATEDAAGQVRTLAGELIAAAEAQKRLLAGNSMDYGDTTMVQNREMLERANPGITAFLSAGYSMWQAFALRTARNYGYLVDVGTPGPRVPGYATGVRNAPGGWAMVGERGPELEYVPRGASIIPNGGFGGFGGITVNIAAGAVVLQDAIIDTPAGQQKLAGRIAAAIIAKVCSIGTRLPSRL